MTNSQKTDEKQTQKNKFSRGNRIGKQFPKGVSGNPAGRPKLTKLSDALRLQLAEINPDAPEETIAEEIAKILIKLAISGDIAAIRECFDRAEGKAKQAIDLDLQINDWRDLAKNYGLSQTDVFNEARLLIEQSDIDSRGE